MHTSVSCSFGKLFLNICRLLIGVDEKNLPKGENQTFECFALRPKLNIVCLLADILRTIGLKENFCTGGGGPVKLSANRTEVLISLAFPLQWADLYQTWNMAFVTNFKTWPYTMTKLLIPSVSEYQENPKAFLHNRVLALYIHINYCLLPFMTKTKDKNFWNLDWYDLNLSRQWGKANFESSLHYRFLKSKCSS